jgi:hypothetical protein
MAAAVAQCARSRQLSKYFCTLCRLLPLRDIPVRCFVMRCIQACLDSLLRSGVIPTRWRAGRGAHMHRLGQQDDFVLRVAQQWPAQQLLRGSESAPLVRGRCSMGRGCASGMRWMRTWRAMHVGKAHLTCSGCNGCTLGMCCGRSSCPMTANSGASARRLLSLLCSCFA